MLQRSCMLTLSIAFLLEGVSSQIGTSICGCQPATYTFTFNFALTCNDNSVGGPGINETACLTEIRGQEQVPNDELVPLSVQNVQIFELDQNLQVVAQTVRAGSFVDGSTFTYTSIISTMTDELNPTTLPRGIQLVTTGLNRNEDTVVNTYIILYENDCGIFPILTEGQTAGWTIFSDLGDPPVTICPIAPTKAPTINPTEMPSTAMPTRAPIKPPSETPILPGEPTRAPATRSPTAAPIEFPVSQPPILAPPSCPPIEGGKGKSGKGKSGKGKSGKGKSGNGKSGMSIITENGKSGKGKSGSDKDMISQDKGKGKDVDVGGKSGSKGIISSSGGKGKSGKKKDRNYDGSMQKLNTDERRLGVGLPEECSEPENGKGKGKGKSKGKGKGYYKKSKDTSSKSQSKIPDNDEWGKGKGGKMYQSIPPMVSINSTDIFSASPSISTLGKGKGKAGKEIYTSPIESAGKSKIHSPSSPPKGIVSGKPYSRTEGSDDNLDRVDGKGMSITRRHR